MATPLTLVAGVALSVPGTSSGGVYRFVNTTPNAVRGDEIHVNSTGSTDPHDDLQTIVPGASNDVAAGGGLYAWSAKASTGTVTIVGVVALEGGRGVLGQTPKRTQVYASDFESATLGQIAPGWANGSDAGSAAVVTATNPIGGSRSFGQSLGGGASATAVYTASGLLGDQSIALSAFYGLNGSDGYGAEPMVCASADAQNGYVALTDTTGSLHLYRRDSGAFTELSRAPKTFPPNSEVRYRLEREGYTIRVRAFQGAEPSTWDIQIDDTTYMTGYPGVRFGGGQGSASPVNVDDVTVQTLALNGVLVFDGDSLTAGTGSSAGINTVTGTTYPAGVLASVGGASLFAAYNFGVGGQQWTAMSADAATQIDALYDPTKAYNVLFAEGGNNDLINLNQNSDPNPPAACLARMAAYCQARRAAGWKVLALTVMRANGTAYQGFTPPYDAQVDALDDLIRANWRTFADGIVDVAADGRLTNPNNGVYFQTDHVHMTDVGYAVWATLAMEALRRLLP